MIEPERLKAIVASAAQQAIKDYDLNIAFRVKKLLYKAEGLEATIRHHDIEANRAREKLKATISRINKLRAGDWTELLGEDESSPSSESGNGETIFGKDEAVSKTNP